MKKIAIVFHSGYGHTLRMAQAVAKGAGAQLVPIDAEGNLPEGGWDTLAAADASSPDEMLPSTSKPPSCSASASLRWWAG
jgi:hypothetical protein